MLLYSFPQICWLCFLFLFNSNKVFSVSQMCLSVATLPTTESTRCRITSCTWIQKCMRQVLRLKQYLEHSVFPIYLRMRSEKYEVMQLQFNLHFSLNKKKFSIYSVVAQSLFYLSETHKPWEWKKKSFKGSLRLCIFLHSSKSKKRGVYCKCPANVNYLTTGNKRKIKETLKAALLTSRWVHTDLDNICC